VSSGNPLQITTLKDLLRPNIRVALADPDATCLGRASQRALGDLFQSIRSKAEILTFSCEETVRAVADGKVDVAVGWHSFRSWYAKQVDLIRPADLGDVYPSEAVALHTADSKQRSLAAEFIRFLGSETGRAILREWGYGTSVSDAREAIAQLDFVRGW